MVIDRTVFDLRIAAHGEATGQINRQEWQRQGKKPRPIRAACASFLFSFAARLDPAHLRTIQAAQSAMA
jgi:hypothetical protein